MPLVTIELLKGRSAQELDTISDATHQAMVELLDVPERDRFQICATASVPSGSGPLFAGTRRAERASFAVAADSCSA